MWRLARSTPFAPLDPITDRDWWCSPFNILLVPLSLGKHKAKYEVLDLALIHFNDIQIYLTNVLISRVIGYT